jgi:heptosyltransferase-3
MVGMRILFISSTRIGDGVLSTGVLSWLLEAYPGAAVTIACGPDVAPLYAAVPRVERIITMAKRPRGGHWLALWRACVGSYWSAIVDLRRSAMRYVLLAGRRFTMPPDRPDIHKVVQLSAMVGREDEPLDPVIWTGPEHDAAAHRLVPDGDPVLALAPTANWGGKEWPAARFVKLIGRLTGADGILPGARVAVLSAPGERERARPVLESVPAARRLDLAGGVDLLTAYSCLRRAGLFVGNDSALMHMSAAAGIPTLGLFGPSRERHYGPWGACAASVRTELSFEDIIGAPGYDHRSAESRMTSLSVDRVVTAAEALWARQCSQVPA